MGSLFSCFSKPPQSAPSSNAKYEPGSSGAPIDPTDPKERRTSGSQPSSSHHNHTPDLPTRPSAPPEPRPSGPRDHSGGNGSRHPISPPLPAPTIPNGRRQSEAHRQPGCMLRAMYAFHAENTSEISLVKGDVYQLIDASVDEWSVVKVFHSHEAEGFVPSSYLQLADLSVDPDWFFGHMERLVAMDILRSSDHGIGNFIIRKTHNRPNGYALSVRCRQDPYEDGAIKHYIISLDETGRCYINERSRFATMEQFIDYYTRHCGGLDVALVAPCQKQVPPIPNRTRRDLRSLYCIDIHQIHFAQGRLGKGNFGEVFKASIRNRMVAVKTLNTNTEDARANFLREAEAMNRYRHPNLVEFICMSFDESTNKLYLVSEFMSRGDLANFLYNRRRTNEPTHINYMMKIGQQVLDGMCYLEKYKVVHRDLRAANVLVGDGDTFKISDFGLLIDTTTVDFSSKFPIRWTAPEAMKDVTKFSTKSDVWSYGLLMVEVTSLGVQPYPELASFRDVQRYVMDRKVHPKPERCPERLYGILLSCWNFDPDRRPNFEGLKNTIEQSLLDKDGHYSED